MGGKAEERGRSESECDAGYEDEPFFHCLVHGVARFLSKSARRALRKISMGIPSDGIGKP